MPETAAAIHYLVYMSHAVRPLSAEELVDLLRVSRRNNLARGVTGMLLYRDALFVQLIEGPLAEVEGLMATIAQDQRHHRVRVLIQGDLEARLFPDWTMAFRDLSGVATRDIPGFSDCLDEQTSNLLPQAKQELLEMLEIVREASLVA
jgi:hypothetical protein